MVVQVSTCFEPSQLEKWNSEIFSGGCSRISKPPWERSSYSNDTFLRLPMMKAGKPDFNQSIEDGCENKCLSDCTCLAYSCGAANCMQMGMSNKLCLMWYKELSDFQEEYSEGLTIFLRTTSSDIGSTSRSCSPCGSYVIPYPLSTAANCGDPSYSNFLCNAATGQVKFKTASGTFRVTNIDPDAKRFSIQVRRANCESRYIEKSVLSSNKSLPFTVGRCSVVVADQTFTGVEQSSVKLDLNWKEPSEPVCNVPSDCHGWPYTTCKAAKGGNKRCICGHKYRWDGSNLKCVRVRFPLKVAVPCIAGALAIVLFSGAFYIHHIQKRSITARRGPDEFKGDDTKGIDVPFFNWESILAATNNFAEESKLGIGGFGAVYKGILPDGKEIAVKRLSIVSVQGVEEFMTEVVLIAKLQHRNLVRLLGYCVKADEKILLYEYMPNGSLDSCLFGQGNSMFLDWEKRFDIIFGIARGLLYLHEDSRLRIIHRDLKPSNILLDEELNPKISDFGVAKIVGGKDTEGSTKRVVGTYGYMSPEYAYEGLFSVKSDVFSFGVVVLETITGLRNSKLFQLKFGMSLQAYVWISWNKDRVLDLLDQNLKEPCNLSEVLKCFHVALLCVQENPNDRPSMSSVIVMLGSKNASLPPPKQPAFSSCLDTALTSSRTVGKSSFCDVITVTIGGR